MFTGGTIWILTHGHFAGRFLQVRAMCAGEICQMQLWRGTLTLRPAPCSESEPDMPRNPSGRGSKIPIAKVGSWVLERENQSECQAMCKPCGLARHLLVYPFFLNQKIAQTTSSWLPLKGCEGQGLFVQENLAQLCRDCCPTLLRCLPSCNMFGSFSADLGPQTNNSAEKRRKKEAKSTPSAAPVPAWPESEAVMPLAPRPWASCCGETRWGGDFVSAPWQTPNLQTCGIVLALRFRATKHPFILLGLR